MPIRLYASCPPEWWPFWLVKHGSSCVPKSRVESVIVDNGAFTFYQRGRYPELSKWLSYLARRAWELRWRAGEVFVVLPDYPMEPARTTLAAKVSRWLCKTYRCMVVMHYDTTDPDSLEALFESYMADVPADLYAVPLKLPTSRGYSRRGRKVLVDEKTQLKVAGIANTVARRMGVHLHLLAPSMTVVKRLWALERVRSIDTTSWTRAVSTELRRRLGTISARNTAERELLFTEYLEQVKKHVELEAWA